MPVTDHTFEDCRLMISAGQLTLPMEAGLVEFTKISKKLKYGKFSCWQHNCCSAAGVDGYLQKDKLLDN